MDPLQPIGQVPNPRPKNWLVESILVTIFCCLPLGIVGIIYASSINTKYDSGDFAGAAEASKQAGMWTKIGFFVGLAVDILAVIYWVFMASLIFHAATLQH
jgi:hypothetical protein